jgi:hypothetical protein
VVLDKTQIIREMQEEYAMTFDRYTVRLRAGLDEHFLSQKNPGFDFEKEIALMDKNLKEEVVGAVYLDIEGQLQMAKSMADREKKSLQEQLEMERKKTEKEWQGEKLRKEYFETFQLLATLKTQLAAERKS